MPQVRKPAVDAAIRDAALRCFAERGFTGTSMATIADAAGVATANIYRYYPDGKAQLLEAVVPAEVADVLETLTAARVQALLLPLDTRTEGRSPAAERLLDFWIEHRLQVVVLLGRSDGTPYAGYGDRFVRLLVDLAVARLDEAGAAVTPTVRHLLGVVFDNTRRALVSILARHEDGPGIRTAVAGFWSYQLPGLDGLYRWALASSGS